jgi:hypothetical protein
VPTEGDTPDEPGKGCWAEPVPYRHRNRRRLRVVSLIVGLALLAAVGTGLLLVLRRSKPTPPVTRNRASAGAAASVLVTRVAGGSLSLGPVKVEVPPNAVSADGRLVLRQLPDPPMADIGHLASHVYDLRFDGPGELLQPVTLRLNFNLDRRADLIVTLATFDEAQKRWLPTPAEVNVERAVLTASLAHFSEYAAIAWYPDQLQRQILAGFSAILTSPPPSPCEVAAPLEVQLPDDPALRNGISVCATVGSASVTIEVQNATQAPFLISLPPETSDANVVRERLKDLAFQSLANLLGSEKLILPPGERAFLTLILEPGQSVRLPVELSPDLGVLKEILDAFGLLGGRVTAIADCGTNLDRLFDRTSLTDCLSSLLTGNTKLVFDALVHSIGLTSTASISAAEGIITVSLPSPNPSPTESTPPGIGEVLYGDGVTIELVAVDFRTASVNEDAAIGYTIRFGNATDASAQFDFTTDGIAGTDNAGTEFGDYFALAQKYWDYVCDYVTAPEVTWPVHQTFAVSAHGSTEVTLFLNPASAQGDCDNKGASRARVGIETDYVDVVIPLIGYRTNHYHEFTDATLRLAR